MIFKEYLILILTTLGTIASVQFCNFAWNRSINSKLYCLEDKITNSVDKKLMNLKKEIILEFELDSCEEFYWDNDEALKPKPIFTEPFPLNKCKNNLSAFLDHN